MADGPSSTSTDTSTPAPERSTSRSASRAAVDVGTNSIRLLVVDGDDRRITREMTITRLGQGVDRTGHLDDEALQRTLDTLATYRDIWQGHGVDRVRIAATSAVRDADNRERFFAGVRELTGHEAEVLDGQQEAALTYLGARRAVELDRAPVMLDIGGGSTEIIVGGNDGEVAASVSLQLGSVRLTERLLPTDPPTTPDIEATQDEIRRQLSKADDALTGAGADVDASRPFVGVAGTVTTLAALYLGLDDYEEERIHGTRVPMREVRRLTAELLTMPSSERARLGPVSPGREDVIGAGALILRETMSRWGFDEVVVSEADILDGLALTS